MIDVPSSFIDYATRASNAVASFSVDPGSIYGVVAELIELFKELPEPRAEPLTASHATLLRRLRYPGGRKFRRACRRLHIRVVPYVPGTGPDCRYCGRPTVPSSDGGPAVCMKTFVWSKSELREHGWSGDDFVWCAPLIEDEPKLLGMPGVQEAGGS